MLNIEKFKSRLGCLLGMRAFSVFHPVVVTGLGKNLLLQSVLGYCVECMVWRWLRLWLCQDICQILLRWWEVNNHTLVDWPFDGYYDVPLFQPDHDLQAHKSSFTDSMYWKTSYLYICASERRKPISYIFFFLLILITLFLFFFLLGKNFRTCCDKIQRR